MPEWLQSKLSHWPKHMAAERAASQLQQQQQQRSLQLSSPGSAVVGRSQTEAATTSSGVSCGRLAWSDGGCQAGSTEAGQAGGDCCNTAVRQAFDARKHSPGRTQPFEAFAKPVVISMSVGRRSSSSSSPACSRQLAFRLGAGAAPQLGALHGHETAAWCCCCCC
uniref:Uncharacterized protein n=1 Tax=Tetradesmus obliquus TaxID=3088 RepID=A0A383W748_TETOB|eukprot:jgi/Sobl393_1/20021/SZX71411.1